MTLTCPPGFITATNLAELAGCTRVTVNNRCRRAHIMPLAIQRVNPSGENLGGKKVYIYPKQEAVKAVLI